jgi:hypothetical protein
LVCHSLAAHLLAYRLAASGEPPGFAPSDEEDDSESSDGEDDSESSDEEDELLLVFPCCIHISLVLLQVEAILLLYCYRSKLNNG